MEGLSLISMFGVAFWRISISVIRAHNRMINKDWQTELLAQGAQIADSTIQHFGNPQLALKQAAEGNVICDLSHLSMIELNGADTLTFLQGQLTNDVKQLNETQAHYTGYCSPKGRLLAFFLGFSYKQSFYLQLPDTLLEPIMKRLKMFVVRSKVQINQAEMISFGISGPDATCLLNQQLNSIPSVPMRQLCTEDYSVVKLPSHQFDRYQITAKPEVALKLWNTLKQSFQPVGKPCWDWLETQAGIPEITAATQEQFVPQMVNLDLINAINFKKGCYTGQEIVARTHYLGTVKRRTYLANIQTTDLPMAADKLMNAEDSEVGQIVRVAPAVDTGFDVLVELRMDAKENGEIFWHKIPLSFKTLPYSLNAGA